MRQNNFNRIRHLHAFTLLEIGIVIVIISLIVGGITISLNLYNNYKLMSIVADTERFRMAVKNFKDQYQYLPGDFPRATSIWPDTGANCTGGSGTFTTSFTPTSSTCNGNGNGTIGQTVGFTAGVTQVEMRERFFLWQHLNLAGYVPNRYTGFSSSASNDGNITPGLNIPATQYSPSLGYTLYYINANYTTVDASRTFPVQGKIGHLFSWSMPGSGIPDASLINAKDAMKLDTKMDDGLPLSGKVFADGTIAACFSGTNYSTSTANTCGQFYRNFLEE